MKLSYQLEQLLNWGLPRMTEEGEALFKRKAETFMKGLVDEAFNIDEQEAFNVARMFDA